MDAEIRLLRLPEVMRRLGMARASVYAAVKRGDLAPPVKLSARSSAWSSVAIEQFIARKIREAGQQS